MRDEDEQARFLQLVPKHPCMGDGIIPWVWVQGERWRNHHLHDA